LRFSKPVPEGEVAATYGIPQKPKPGPKAEVTTKEERAKGEEEQPGIEAEDDVENGKPGAEEAEVRIESKSSD
jgi:phosphatidylglycerol---prolipoprotein diacylglyceryl transferase